MNEDLRYHSTKQWLSELANDSTAAFTQLFEAYHPKVMHSAFLILRQKELAEDVVQDVFMKCWTKRAELENIDDFESWLFIVTRNKSINLLEKLARADGKHEELLTRLPQAVDDTDSRTILNLHKASLQKALALLTEQQRNVFELSHFEGLTRSEIAQQLSLSPNTVKMHLMRALRVIRAQMADNLDVLILCFLLENI